NQLPKLIADPMRSSNMEYIREGDYLYMMGGYGYDSILNHFQTYPKLTAIHVDNMINAVINALPIASTVRQVVDTNLAVCGGELGKTGSTFYLMGGHNFGGRYTDPDVGLFTQKYSDQLKKFNLTDDGTTITLSGFTYQVDTNNFHRRDFNMGPIIEPSGAQGMEVFGGVFRKDSTLPFREPITIDAGGVTVNAAYHQVMSQYTCAMLPIYDSVTKDMYTTFLGGISLYDYNPTSHIAVRDSLVPFVSDITTLTTHASGAIEETVLPTQLPGLLGSNSKLIPTQHVPSYSNEVIKIRDLANTKTLVGYLFGGIRAAQNNLGSSISNDTIYRVYIIPNNTLATGINETSNSIQNTMLFPNPATQNTTLLFNLKNTGEIKITLFDITGKEMMLIADEEMQKGNQQININTSKLSAGIYICKVQSDGGERLLKLVIAK
ncbi:MAG: T9SS type A sorting domain-containing protein, partial [Bacteroidia bacterium]